MGGNIDESLLNDRFDTPAVMQATQRAKKSWLSIAKRCIEASYYLRKRADNLNRVSKEQSTPIFSAASPINVGIF